MLCEIFFLSHWGNYGSIWVFVGSLWSQQTKLKCTLNTLMIFPKIHKKYTNALLGLSELKVNETQCRSGVKPGGGGGDGQVGGRDRCTAA